MKKSHRIGALTVNTIKYLTGAVFLLLLAYITVLAFPQPVFPYRVTYQNYEVWSDRPIPPQINTVLDDATRRLNTSAIYDRGATYKIFFCNSPWRLWLYGQHFSARIGGAADTWLTRHIYIRASDIAANKIISPPGGPLADAAHRPLSYFIAHEATHVIESRQFGRLVAVRSPRWLFEGYADYVGKGGDFDVAENTRLYQSRSRMLDFKKSGLYRGFHPRVALLLDKKGMRVQQLFDNPPDERTLNELLSQPPGSSAAVAAALP